MLIYLRPGIDCKQYTNFVRHIEWKSGHQNIIISHYCETAIVYE